MKISDITYGPIMKMHGTGNDFVVMTDFDEQLTSDHAKKICDRHFGIGADGLIAVMNSRVPEAVYRMRFFNPDGSEAEMCGNGIRCFAKYLRDNAYSGFEGNVLNVDTGAGIIRKIIRPEILSNSGVEALVRVDMGRPVLYNPGQINLSARKLYTVSLEQTENGEMAVGRSGPLEFTFVSMGNPHAVIFSGNPKEDVRAEGPGLEAHRDVFPQKTNVEFVRVNAPDDLTMYVWERGAGETLACGTGACASLVASVLNGHSKDHARVHLLGGDLDISWAGKDNSVYMTGPARNVCKIDAESLDRYLFSED